MVETQEGWHWLAVGRKLRYEPYTEVVVGKTVRAKGKLVICENGVHGSSRALDALQYARGPIISRCTYTGPFVAGADKFCGRSRTPLWIADASTVLHEFACWCAEQALELLRVAGGEPDPRSRDAIAAKRAWLRGEVTDEQLVVARYAAWDVVRASRAVRATAEPAAESAWAAARYGAWVSAWDAAIGAALVAKAGTRTSAASSWEAQNVELERMLYALAPVEP